MKGIFFIPMQNRYMTMRWRNEKRRGFQEKEKEEMMLREGERGGWRKQSHSHHMQLTPASVDTINSP